MAKFEDLRVKYLKDELIEENVPQEPFSLFQQWMVKAINDHVIEPNAMVLSTVQSDGFPQSRVVLLKETRKEGFIFYTNYNSHKAQDISKNNRVSLLFMWLESQRQIRIVGHASKIDENLSETYFKKRPKGSQLGAWASPQSKEIPNRSFLEKTFNLAQAKFHDKEVIEKPEFWGGYIVEPISIEFWQGRDNRMHDRLKYIKEDESWKIIRLAP